MPLAEPVEQVVAQDQPERREQGQQQQRADRQEAERSTRDRLRGDPPSSADRLPAGLQQLAALLVEAARQHGALLMLTLELAVEREGDRPAAQTVLLEPGLLPGRLAGVPPWPLRVGSRKSCRRRASTARSAAKSSASAATSCPVLQRLEALELGLQAEAHQLQLGHALHAIDIDLDQAIGEAMISCRPAPCSSMG